MSNDCELKVVAASKGKWSEKDARNFFLEVERQLQDLKAKGQPIDYVALADNATINVKQIQYKVAQKRYSLLEDAKKLQGNVQRLVSYEGSLEDSLKFRCSQIETTITRKQTELNAALAKDLESAGLLEFYRANESPELVARYSGQLTKLDAAARPAITSIPEAERAAFRTAEIITNWRDGTLKILKDQGAPIGYLEGRQGRNTWDPLSIEANRDAFVQRVMTDSDWDKIYLGEFTKEQVVENLLDNLQSGVHSSSFEDVGNFEAIFGPAVKQQISSDIAQKLGKSRKIHLKDDKWHQFQIDFGKGDFYELIQNDIRDLGRSMALIEEIGSNPDAMWETMIRKTMEQTKKLGKEGKHPLAKHMSAEGSALWGTLTGRTDQPQSYFWARVGSSTRKFLNSLLLGGSVVTSSVDPGGAAVRASALASARTPALGNEVYNYMAEVTENYKKVAGLYGDPYAKSITVSAIEELEDFATTVMTEAKLGDMFSTSDLKKTVKGNWIYATLDKVDAVHSFLLKKTGMETWTNRRLADQYSSVAREFGFHAGKNFNDLPKQTRNWLRELGIDDLWDYAKNKTMGEGERIYIAPDIFDNITDEEIKALKGVDDERGIANARRAVRTKWKAAFLQEAKSRLSVPDVATRAGMTAKLTRGTALGELGRTAMQFKSYPITFLQKSIAPVIKSGKYGVLGTAMGVMTLINIQIMGLNAILKGQTPPVFWDGSEESVGNWTGVIARTMGLPYLDDLVPRLLAEGRLDAGNVLLNASGPFIQGSLKNLVAAKDAIGGAMEGDTDKVLAKTIPIAYNAPVIGPILHGHILGKTVTNALYGTLLEMFDPNHEAKLDEFAEKQGSRYYNLYRDSDQFLEDLTNGNQ